MQGLRAGGPSGRWAQGAVSRLSGHVATWGKGNGLDGRGRLQSRALETQREGEGEWVEWEVQKRPGITPLPTAPWAPTICLTCICRGNGSSFFLKHFGIKVPEFS